MASATHAVPGKPAVASSILVVDDDPISRSLQSRLLGLLGHRARVVERPADALDLALTDGFDAMLLDLEMPEIDGFALLASLRDKEARLGRRPLPVIAVTGYAASIDRMRCLMAGFNDYMPKPLDVNALEASLARNLPPLHAVGPLDSDALRVEAAARRLAQAKPSDASFAPTLLEAFAMRSGQLIEEISIAHAAHDAAALKHAVQSLRASADFMGATGLAALCDQLQAAVTDQSPERTAALVRSLSDEHQSVLVVLLRPASSSPLAA
jgi:two-component system, sensor histidine kinase and response regulator